MKHIILLAVLALAGCGDASDESSANDAVEPASDVLGESFHDNLDAAEAVEEEVMKAKENLDAAMEEAEGAN